MVVTVWALRPTAQRARTAAARADFMVVCVLVVVVVVVVVEGGRACCCEVEYIPVLNILGRLASHERMPTCRGAWERGIGENDEDFKLRAEWIFGFVR